ncbi:MAG: hypothetical protein A2512_03755 [Deltaproteobacteria bacterium RIFOXYD12_FULL_56_24]|nr:MAG: hypothetical protein A2512_03755 [Deltaproteobacteria bacterium RIFOXYD12_FULL_56_24]
MLFLVFFVKKTDWLVKQGRVTCPVMHMQKVHKPARPEGGFPLGGRRFLVFFAGFWVKLF